MTELSGLDLVMPTAEHNRADLLDFWIKTGLKQNISDETGLQQNDVDKTGLQQNALDETGSINESSSHNPRLISHREEKNSYTHYLQANKIANVVAVPLAAEIDGKERNRIEISSLDKNHIKILFVSTLEPRKNHICFLKAAGILFREHPELVSKTEIILIGNRYAGNDDIPAAVQDFCSRHTNVKWLGVVDDDTLKNEYSACTFTVYPSLVEGFGMPIVESLWAGKPCICSDSGSIGELAAKGGCLICDVKDEHSIAAAMYKMMTDEDLFIRLQHQAVKRDIVTWEQYSDNIIGLFEELKPDFDVYKNRRLPQEVRCLIQNHFKINDIEGCKCPAVADSYPDKNMSQNNQKPCRMIVVSSYYPPESVGGAEIIAHNQARTLVEASKARVVAFSLDESGRYPYGTVYAEEYEGIPVVRLALDKYTFDNTGINFFNKYVNEAFTDLCSIVKPDIVHCHNLIGLSLGIIDIAKEYGAKAFVTLHDNWWFCYRNTRLNYLDRLCCDFNDCDKCMESLHSGGHMSIPIGVRQKYFKRTARKVDAFISPSKYLKDAYVSAEYDSEKIIVCPNGIDTEKFAGVVAAKLIKSHVTMPADAALSNICIITEGNGHEAESQVTMRDDAALSDTCIITEGNVHEAESQVTMRDDAALSDTCIITEGNVHEAESQAIRQADAALSNTCGIDEDNVTLSDTSGIDTEKFAKTNEKHIDVTTNTPDNIKENIEGSGKINISYVGYFGNHKGIDVLIRALGLLKNKYGLEPELILAGYGTEEENYRKIAAECGISAHISFPGKIDNSQIADIYMQTDIYCLPSVWPENQPVSITEAMACGIPVIASDMGGNSELVKNGITGFLFEAGNYEELAEKIRTLVQSPALACKMGAAGRNAMEDMDFHKRCEELFRIYNDAEAACNYKDGSLKADVLPKSGDCSELPVSENVQMPDEFQVCDSDSPAGLSKPGADIVKCSRKLKKIIFFKGMFLPYKIDMLTSYDVMLWQWALTEQDYEYASALVLLPGEALDRAELYLLEKYNIMLAAPKSECLKYLSANIRIMWYSDNEELMEIVVAQKDIWKA